MISDTFLNMRFSNLIGRGGGWPWAVFADSGGGWYWAKSADVIVEHVLTVRKFAGQLVFKTKQILNAGEKSDKTNQCISYHKTKDWSILSPVFVSPAWQEVSAIHHREDRWGWSLEHFSGGCWLIRKAICLHRKNILAPKL